MTKLEGVWTSRFVAQATVASPAEVTKRNDGWREIEVSQTGQPSETAVTGITDIRNNPFVTLGKASQRERERERQRQRDRQRQRQTETDRQTDRQKERQTDRQTEVTTMYVRMLCLSRPVTVLQAYKQGVMFGHSPGTSLKLAMLAKLESHGSAQV